MLPLLVITELPAFDVLKKPTTELDAGLAPAPLLLILAVAAVALPRKFRSADELVLVMTEVAAVELSLKLQNAEVALLRTALAAVAALKKSRLPPPVVVIVLRAAELFTMPAVFSSMPPMFVIV